MQLFDQYVGTNPDCCSIVANELQFMCALNYRLNTVFRGIFISIRAARNSGLYSEFCAVINIRMILI